MRRLCSLAGVVAVVALMVAWQVPTGAAPPLPSSSALASEHLQVILTATTDSATLGESLDLSIDVSNTGDRVSPAVVVHLDITDPSQAESVDPEDWTPTLSQPLDPIEAGKTATATWTIQPISSGEFAVYAVVLTPGDERLTVSDALLLGVTHQRSLDPGGILAVSLGAPAVVGALFLGQWRLARRRRST